MTDMLVKPPARCATMAPSTRILKSLFRLELQRGCGTAAVESPISSNLHHLPSSNLPASPTSSASSISSTSSIVRSNLCNTDSQQLACRYMLSTQSRFSTQSTLSTHSTHSTSVCSGYEPPSCQAARLQLSQQRLPYCNLHTVPQHLSTE